MPELTPAEFEQLCDRLFAGPEDSDWSAEPAPVVTSSMRVTGSKDVVPTAPIDHALDAAKPVALSAPTIGRGAVAVSSARRRAQRLNTPQRSSRSWTSGLRWTWVVLFTLVGGGLVFDGWRGERVTQATHTSPLEIILETRSIEQIRLGDRIAGRNPLREQAETIEPDPATWRRISLEMRKPSGARVWIELLRPLEWLDAVGARPGHSIELELHEMGAVGPAQVTAIGPCPEIQPGDGTVVTGTFKHEADAGNRVVHLRLEGQLEPTGVTDTHQYWSVDRQEFVEVGELRAGERIDTAYGLKDVISITPIEHNGFLHNLETTEHVYRVGSLGTLVHNSCVIHGKPQFTSAAHAKSMQNMANRMAKSGAYTDVYMHSKWTTILKGKGVRVSPNQLPDVAGIRLDGKIDIIEFASSARDYKYGNLLGRNRDIWKQLPQHLRGDILVYDELGNWTLVFP